METVKENDAKKTGVRKRKVRPEGMMPKEAKKTRVELTTVPEEESSTSIPSVVRCLRCSSRFVETDRLSEHMEFHETLAAKQRREPFAMFALPSQPSKGASSSFQPNLAHLIHENDEILQELSLQGPRFTEISLLSRLQHNLETLLQHSGPC